MFRNRRLSHESLECRRLLAATCVPVDFVSPNDAPTPIFDGVPMAESEFDASPMVSAPLVYPFPDYTNSYGSDLVQEVGNRVFVVDQLPYRQEPATLYVFNRDADGVLLQIAKVDVGFMVDRMIPVGDKVLLFNNYQQWDILAYVGLPDDARTTLLPPPSNQATRIVTVNLNDSVDVIRQEIRGTYHSIDVENDRLVITGYEHSDVVIAIYPAPPTENFVKTFDITSEGIVEVASATFPQFGRIQVNGRNLYSAATPQPDVVYFTPEGVPRPSNATDSNIAPIRQPDDATPIPTASFTKYVLGDDVIREVQTIELGPGYVTDFKIAENGQTGLVLRNEYLGSGPSVSIDLLNFSSDSFSVFEQIHLQNFQGETLSMGADYLVLRNYIDNSLVVVNTNQSIDLVAENRVRRIEIPARLDLQYESLRVSEDSLLLRALRRPIVARGESSDGQDPSVANDGTVVATDESQQSVLLTVSISAATIVADTNLPELVRPYSALRLFSIDTDSSRFGFVSSDYESPSQPQLLTFGRLNDSGEFIRDGALPVGRWLEIDANADRLLARTSDRLLEFEWVRNDDPVVTLLGDPEPPITAMDDVYTLNNNGEDHYLDVLANDLIARDYYIHGANIVELIGAPDGVEIVNGQSIRVSAATLARIDGLRFEYVISDGENRSSAAVEIHVNSISEVQIRELVQAVRQRVAFDFDVAIDRVEVISVERYFDSPPVPIDSGSALSRLLLPSVLVTVSVPDATARYRATLDREITQVSVTQHEFVAELGLRAVDKNGQRLEHLVEGQEFWLEFNARDLRPGGRGVYAAFFDLVVPTEHLKISGPVVYAAGFSGIKTGSFTQGEIDDLGAIGSGGQSTTSDRQSLLRIGVTAIAAGQFTLRPESADGIGTATLVQGLLEEVPERRVRYQPLKLSITATPEPDPLDVNDSGNVTAGDALDIIRFLNLYGSVSFEELEATVRGVRGNSEMTALDELEMRRMRRLDASGDHRITALDALTIVNDLQRQALAEFPSVALDSLIEDDDESR